MSDDAEIQASSSFVQFEQIDRSTDTSLDPDSNCDSETPQEWAKRLALIPSMEHEIK
jgi:hypothetical protein